MTIRVLIVDDDKLVRKGLASSMPWKEFGMEIVGEANNGENALKFMEECKVDLLITDLSMPVMSGIELMRIVREKYPQVQIVVLTLHQDFEYVQEALRLGAIDYIAKIQLEQEQFEEVLSRIVTLMERKDGAKSAPHPQEEWVLTDELFVYYSLNTYSEDGYDAPSIPEKAVEVENGVWCWAGEGEGEGQGKGKEGHGNGNGLHPLPSHPNYALVRFAGIKGMDRKKVLELIRAYRKNDLFYDADPSQVYHTVKGPDIFYREKSENLFAMDKLKEQWSRSDWIYEESVYEDMLRDLKAAKMPPVRLARIFFSVSDEWNRLYQQLLSEPIVIDDFFPNWIRFESWLGEARDRIRIANAKPLFSKEIQNSIVKAMNLAQQRINEPISAAEIAQMVNMSASYFSQCFKQYVGQTYTDYVRDIRMERAKEYLRNTTKTIHWIAEQIGYNDEKYFSRLFREQVGLLPSEYRQHCNEGHSKTV